jgi:signal transduction histidine kinase
MAALLSSGVAHNFNNLLQAIMGQASLIELESLNQDQRIKIAGMIMDAASKGANLVKQLYSFSSESTFSPDILSLRTLIVDLRDRFKAQLGPEIKLEYQLADDSLEIKGDHSMIRQVFSNLIENAKEALQGVKEGVVKISANRIRVRSGEVHSDLAPGSYVSIVVEDNGAGMSEEAIARCFEPFYSTKNVDPRTGLSFSGAGLGLSAAYLIVRQHEGAISANSLKSQGTSFTVYLPVVTLKSNDTDKTGSKSLKQEELPRKTQAK